ncbi:hypothetical protein KFU94_50745 [Chloroflexi bacterium TSY]|nr:hypothetical protein [Chloroflexi bacterium TSY]
MCLGAGLLAPPLALQTNGFSDAVPTIISYHGTLRDAEGNPLSGIHEMVFRIYNDVTAPTSEAVWTEEHAQVTVRDGQFNVLLGDLEPISADIFQNANRFIGITVDDLDEMVPRQRFAAVPYAIAAAGATYLSASDGDPLKAVSVDVDGQVGIGTESPEAPLHVQADGQNMHISGNSINVSDTVKMNDSTAGNVSVAAGGGNFGIGTTEPTKLLQVSGDNPEVNLEFGPGAASTVAEISVSGAKINWLLSATIRRLTAWVCS